MNLEFYFKLGKMVLLLRRVPGSTTAVSSCKISKHYSHWLARTIETVEGGGLVVFPRTVNSLRQLTRKRWTLMLDSGERRPLQRRLAPRFNERHPIIS